MSKGEYKTHRDRIAAGYKSAKANADYAVATGKCDDRAGEGRHSLPAIVHLMLDPAS